MNDFIRARNFNVLAAKGRRVTSESGRAYIVFQDSEDAGAFARYVGGFARRVINGATTRATVIKSDKQGGYIANLSITYPNFGKEEGIVICKDDQAVGILIKHDSRVVLLPIQQHTLTARTESGTLYVRFADGTAFCRSKGDGPQPLAHSLFFTSNFADASAVMQRGGELLVTKTATRGLYPVYALGVVNPGDGQYRMNFKKGAFRLGTKVRDLWLG